jgi:SAM-dependent methyltransferase
MSLDALMAVTQKLSASMDALAALGAELRLRTEQTFVSPQVRHLILESVRHLDPALLTDIAPDEEWAALSIIESQFGQALDLLRSPQRSAGWTHEDSTILNGQGLISRRFVRDFESLAKQSPGLNATLRQPGTFLDVGTGTGWLAIEVARAWPTWNVVGIDRFEPALRLARKNVESSGVGIRIELRAQSLEQLEDIERFSLAWLPGAFLPSAIMTGALERTRRSLVSGGWVLFALFTPPSGPGGETLSALKVSRNGGHLWSASEVTGHLNSSGFEEVISVSTRGSTIIAGKRTEH